MEKEAGARNVYTVTGGRGFTNAPYAGYATTAARPGKGQGRRVTRRRGGQIPQSTHGRGAGRGVRQGDRAGGARRKKKRGQGAGGGI